MTAPTNGEDNSRVTFSVRELLTEIRTTVAAIDAKLDSKAEKSIVENIDRRVAAIEVERRSQIEYGARLIEEFRDLQKEQAANDKAITVLQTQKKDKDAFNVLWVPIAFNIVLGLVAVYLSFVRSGVHVP